MFEKQVIFEISGSQYSFNSMYVRTVEANTEIRPYSGMPECIVGLSKLRGEVVPICDLHKKFRVKGNTSGQTEIVFINTAEGCLGCIVDAVVEIGAVAEELQYELPSIIRNENTEYVAGILSNNGQLVTAVNGDRLLTPDEKQVVSRIIGKIRADNERDELAKREAELVEAKKKAEAEMAAAKQGEAAEAVAEKKPVDQPAEEKKPAVGKKAAEKKPAAEKKAAEKKPAAEKKAAEKKLAAEKKAAEKKPAAEKKVAVKKPAAEKKPEKK